MVIATHLHAHLIQRELDRLYELHQHNYTCCKCRITLSAAAVQPPRGETPAAVQQPGTWQQPGQPKLPRLAESTRRIPGKLHVNYSN